MAGKRPISQSSEYPPPKRAFTDGSIGNRPTTDPRLAIRSPASSTTSRSSAAVPGQSLPAPVSVVSRARNLELNQPSQPQTLLYDLLAISADLTIAEHQHNLIAGRHSQARLELDKARQRGQFSSAVELQERAFQKLDHELQASQTRLNNLRSTNEAKCDQFTTTFLQPSRSFDETELDKRLIAKFDGLVNSRAAQAKMNETALEAKLMAKIDEVMKSRMTESTSELEHRHEEQMTARDATHEKIIAERAREVTELRGLMRTLQNDMKGFREKIERDQKVLGEALQKVQSAFDDFKEDTLPRLIRFESYTEAGPELPETAPHTNLKDELESLRSGLEECQKNVKHATEVGLELPKTLPLTHFSQDIKQLRDDLSRIDGQLDITDATAKGALDLLQEPEDPGTGLIARVEALESFLGVNDQQPGISPRLDEIASTVKDLSENRVSVLEGHVNKFGPKIDGIEKLDRQVGEEFERIGETLERITGAAPHDSTSQDGRQHDDNDTASLHQLKSMIDDLTSQLASIKSQTSKPSQAENSGETESLPRLKSMIDDLTLQLADVKSQASHPLRTEKTGETVAKQEFEELKTKGDLHRLETEALKRIIQIVQDKVNFTTTEHVTEAFANWFREQGINYVRTGIPELAQLAQMVSRQATIHEQVTQISTFEDRLTDLRALIERVDRVSRDKCNHPKDPRDNPWKPDVDKVANKAAVDLQDVRKDQETFVQWQREVNVSLQEIHTSWPHALTANITGTLQDLQAQIKQQTTTVLTVSDTSARMRKHLDDQLNRAFKQTEMATQLEELNKSQADLSKRVENHERIMDARQTAMKNGPEEIRKMQTEPDKRVEHGIPEAKQTDLRNQIKHISNSQIDLCKRVEDFITDPKQSYTKNELQRISKLQTELGKKVEDHIADTVALDETRDKDIGDLQGKVFSMSTLKQGFENLNKLVGRVDVNEKSVRVLESARQEELVKRTEVSKTLEEGRAKLATLQEGIDAGVATTTAIKQDLELLGNLAARVNKGDARCRALEVSREEELVSRTQMQNDLDEGGRRLAALRERLDAVPSDLATELKTRDKVREEERQKIDVAFVSLTRRLRGLDVRGFEGLDRRLEGLKKALEVESSKCRERVEELANRNAQPQVPSGPTSRRLDGAERRLGDLEHRCNGVEAFGIKYDELKSMLKRAQRSNSVIE